MMKHRLNYMEELLVRYRRTRTLHSADKGLLVETKYNIKTYGYRAFSQAAPKIWNSMSVYAHVLSLALSSQNSTHFFLSVLFSCILLFYYYFIIFNK